MRLKRTCSAGAAEALRASRTGSVPRACWLLLSTAGGDREEPFVKAGQAHRTSPFRTIGLLKGWLLMGFLWVHVVGGSRPVV